MKIEHIQGPILYCGEPHLCGQLPKQHTSEPVYVVVNNSYTVNPICNHNCVQKYTSVYPLLLTKLFACMFRVLPYWRPEWQTRSPTAQQLNSPSAAAACAHQAAAIISPTIQIEYIPTQGSVRCEKIRVRLVPLSKKFGSENRSVSPIFSQLSRPTDPPNLIHKWQVCFRLWRDPR